MALQDYSFNELREELARRQAAGPGLAGYSSEELSGELSRREFKLAENWPDSPDAWWKITTAGDCEGRSARVVTIAQGHLGDLALQYAGHAIHSLRFSPAVATPILARPLKSVHFQLGVNSGTWPPADQDAARIAIQRWLGSDWKVEPSPYFATFKISRSTPSAADA